jgi:hypothetical protein
VDGDEFWAVKGGAEVEVSDVEGAKFGARPGEDTVDHEFDEFERGCPGADIAGVANAVATDGDASAIRVGFFGTDLADHIGVSDFLAAVQRYVFVVNDIEGVCAFDAFGGAIGCGANALAEAAQFVGIGFAPYLSERRVFVELALFEGFAGVVV